MGRIGDWSYRHPMLLGFIIILVVVGLVSGLFMAAHESIPLCQICGQKQYRLEVAYYITTFVMVGKVMVPTQTPVYRTVQHSCPGKKLHE